MQLALQSKSFVNSNPIHSFAHLKDETHKSQPSLYENSRHIIPPCPQRENCLKTYHGGFSQHRRRNNVNIFNFFIKKSPKKIKQTERELSLKSNQRDSFQQTTFFSKKFVQPYPSLSSQKLKIIHIDSEKRLQISTQKAEKGPQQVCRYKYTSDHIINKINENFSKNTKFDRKKYMYYRYRKKNMPNKNNVSSKDLPQYNEQQRPIINRAYAYLNTKADELQSNSNIQGNDHCKRNLQFKRSFYKVIPDKNKSFSEIKCKLTIEPMRRQASFRLIDRESLSKTSRQMRQKRQMNKNGTKVFSQAIHFKSRKQNRTNQDQNKQNPEAKSFCQKEDKILGWNFAEQQSHEQQYF